MGDLTHNFSRWEFACKCGCGFDTVDYELLTLLQDFRRHFGRRIVIYSGVRCSSYNALVGGATDSQHLVGKAADFHIEGIIPEMVYNYLNDRFPNKYGIGLYEWGIHFDVRSDKARW